MKNFVQEGNALDLVAPVGGVVSGSVYKVGAIIAVASVTAAEGAPYAGWTEGVYDVVKHGAGSGQVWAVGDILYWDDTNKRFTKTATDNTKAGVAVAAALTADTVGRVKLMPTI